MKLYKKFKDDFNMDSTRQGYFWKSQWEKFDPSDKLLNVSLVYLSYRFLFLCYFIGGTIYSLINTKERNLYLIFLTNWSFTLQLIYGTIYLGYLSWIWIKRRKLETRLFSFSPSSPNTIMSKNDAKLPVPLKIIWGLLNIVLVLPYAVTFGYWVFLYNPKDEHLLDVNYVGSNFIVHALNSVIAFFDTMIIAVPIRIAHMVFPICMAFLYTAFSGFYELAKGPYTKNNTYIYSILDWKSNPGYATLSSIIGILFAGFGHLILAYAVYRGRIFLAEKCLGRKIPSQQEPNTTSTSRDNLTSFGSPSLISTLDDIDKEKIENSNILNSTTPVNEPPAKDYNTFPKHNSTSVHKLV